MGCSRAVIFDVQNETSCAPGSTLTNLCDQSQEIRKTYVHRHSTGRPLSGQKSTWEKFASDLREARFWLTSCWRTIRPDPSSLASFDQVAISVPRERRESRTLSCSLNGGDFPSLLGHQTLALKADITVAVP
jgi:hypothetical protein